MSAVASGLHVCLPGVIESWDPITQTASVKPTVRNPITDLVTGAADSEDPITIPNVMVVTPRGGGFHISFPYEKGDHVVLVFSDLATGQWRASGEVSEPLDVRRHSLGYPFAFPGAFPDSDALTDPVNPLFLGKMIIGKDGDPAQSIRIGAAGVECGGILPMPLAMAAGVASAFGAIQTALAAVVTHINAAAPPPDPTTITLNAAMVTLGTAMTTALALIPATITKGQ